MKVKQSLKSLSFKIGILIISVERNPYYWKVDTDFNQLPYIDNIEFAIYPNNGDMRQAAKDGQIDMQYTALSIKESNYDE